VARIRDVRGVNRFLVGRPKGKRPLGRPRRRWEDNIKMNLRETGIREMRNLYKILAVKILQKEGTGIQTAFRWLRTESTDVLL
jgi:hypothetical protein